MNKFKWKRSACLGISLIMTMGICLDSSSAYAQGSSSNLLTNIPKLSVGNLDLNQMKNDSKVVTDLLASFLKESGKLLISGKDLRIGIEKTGQTDDEYAGLRLSNVKTKEGISILGGQDHQRRNIMLRYEAVASGGSLVKTYGTMTDTLWGKGFYDKSIKPLFEEALKLEAGTTSAKVIGGSWDASAVFGKSSEGVAYVSLSGNTLVKTLGDQLTGLVKNTEVKFKAVSGTSYLISVTDKTTTKLVASVAVDFKAGTVKVTSRGDAGLDVFKKVANIGLKQADPSGKTTYDTVFAKQNDLLKEYEKLSKALSANKAYELVSASGAKTLLKNDSTAMNLLAEKYKLKDQLFIKDGAPALPVKVGLLNGWLYMKEGYLHFVMEFYPVK